MGNLNKIQFGILRNLVTTSILSYTAHCVDNYSAAAKGGVLLYENVLGVEQHTMVGVSVSKYEDHLAVARKNVFQLGLNPKDVSSFQSRNLETNYQGGAVRVPRFGIFSLTGLTELANEACLLSALFHGQFVDHFFVDEILEMSNNQKLYVCIQGAVTLDTLS